MDASPKVLFIQWLQEAHDRAAARPNAKYAVQAYSRSLESLRSHQGELQSRRDLKALPYVGDKTVSMLLKKLESHCKDCEIEFPEDFKEKVALPAEKAGKTASTRAYIPRYGSTSYHVLLCLRRHEIREPNGSGLGRKDVLRIVKPDLMQTMNGGKQVPNIVPAFTVLVSKALIYSRSGRYYLEELGRDVADGLLKVATETAGLAPLAVRQPSLRSPVTQRNAFKFDTWAPEDYAIRMLLDTREVAGRDNRDGFARALEDLGINMEVFALSLGDVLWVAEHKRTKQQAVLGYIVERKSLRDLVQSIMDGRFQEQKSRLEKSRLPHVVYLIEHISGQDLNQHAQRIQTAMSQIVTVSNFFLKQTAGQSETVLYLSQLSREIERKYTGMPLKVVIPNSETFQHSMIRAYEELGCDAAVDFCSFDEGLSKSRAQTVGDIFTAMLMTVKGVSAEKAQTVQRLYPTPFLLWRAYECESTHEDRQLMLHRQTKDNIPRRRIRPEISEALFDVWNNEKLGTVAT